MLLDRNTLSSHARWIATVSGASAAALIWYLLESWSAPRWPGGSSRPGIVFGSLGGFIIVFELLLWPRKRVRAWRLGRAQAWLRAHIWLGLLSVPLVALHSGGHLGGQLSTAVTVVFAIVIASGLWGLALQQFLPKLMLARVPAETIYAEIDSIAAQNFRDADDLVIALCGPAKDFSHRTFQSHVDQVGGSHLTVGTYRQLGKTRGKVLQARAPSGVIPGSEPLRKAFDRQIGPYLAQGGRRVANELSDTLKSAQMFAELKALLDPATHGAIDDIEELCHQRRQFDAQVQLHHWLHGWLLIHAPLSVMLLALLVLHVYFACKYW
jgi:hypothetical protein